MMPWKFPVMLAGLALLSCGPKSPYPDIDFMGGCSHDNVLPELKLNEAHQALLAKRSDPPRTAFDYYMGLPVSFFGNVEDTTPERRVTFINLETLSDRWLEAAHFFDCDGGGFEVTLRVFESDGESLIGISVWEHAEVKALYEKKEAVEGEIESISVDVPQFWRVVDGKWVRAKDVVLPVIDPKAVIDRYKNHFQPKLTGRNRSNSIWLQYKLPKSGNEIRLQGRANFMDPYDDPVWQILRFEGRSFTEVPLKD